MESHQHVIIKISNIPDVRSISGESFVNGDLYSIKIWNGFNFGDLLSHISHIMENEKGEEDYNLERTLFYTKDGDRFEFGCDDTIVKKDYFNVVIIKDDYEQLMYAHSRCPYIDEDF
jgi:hypothetical protein